jgi:hypothetical protein
LCKGHVAAKHGTFEYRKQVSMIDVQRVRQDVSEYKIRKISRDLF